MKRLLSLNLALILLLSLFPMATVASAASDTGYAILYKNVGSEESKEVEISNFSSWGSLQMRSLSPFEEEDKVIVGYNTKADGSGTRYSLTDSLNEVFSCDEAKPAKLYAQWEDAPGNHILYLSSRALTADGKDYVIQSGLTDTATLLGEDTFLPTSGQKVIGWSTANYYGTQYPCGSTISVSGDQTFFAIIGYNCITRHYLKYNYSSGAYKTTIYTAYYTNDTEIGAPDIYVNDRVFVGWNEKKDGSGAWYTSNDSIIDAPQELYAQYEEYPDGEYCVLRSRVGLDDGRECDVIPLPDDGMVMLPSTLRDGAVAAYWYDSVNGMYFPGGTASTVKDGAHLGAVVAQDSTYYGLIDGNGGVRANGGKYQGMSCSFSSAGDMSVYPFVNAIFTKEGSALIGFKGEKTGTVYDMYDDSWDAMGSEADERNVAHFTAQYQEVSGGYIQYFGNYCLSEDGESFVIQDGLDFDAQNSEKIQENPFVPEEGMFFLGWNTKASDSGTWYDAGDEIDLTGNTLLYAQWGKRRVTYHYTKNEAEYEFVRLYQGVEPDLSEGEGLFEGWNTEKDGSGTWYCPGDAIPDGAVIDLYEQRVSLPEEGYYYVLHGSKQLNGKMVAIVPMESETETITLPDFGMGWKYSDTNIGWSGFVDQQENIFAPGSELEITSGSELYRFSGGGGSVAYHANLEGNDTVRVYYTLSSHGSLYLHSGEDLFDVGSTATFRGWNTKEDGTGVSYSAGRYMSLYSNYTLYAQWKGIVGHPTDVEAGVNETASFKVTAIGEGLTYQWQSKSPDGEWTDIDGVTSATFSVNAQMSDDDTQYRCVVKDKDGNSLTSQAAILSVLKKGLHQDENGIWKYYVNDVVATEFTGMVNYYGTLFYVANGILDWGYTGLVQHNGVWYCVNGGVQDLTCTGLVQHDETWYYVANGVVDTNYTGMVDYYGTLFYVADGVLDWAYTGLAEYSDVLYYISDGVQNTSYIGMVQHGETWYYVTDGTVDTGYVGLVYDNSVWYYITGGQQDTGYVGLAQHGEDWHYVSGGAVDTSFTGMVDYYGTLFYVTNGMVDWSYSGLAYYNDLLCYVSGGVQDLNYTGLTYYNNVWYYVSEGVQDLDYTGLARYHDNWFYVANGVVDWTYTGLAQYYDNWFYMANGELDWNFTGLVDYCGTQFYVAGGVVDWDYVGLGCFNGTWYFVRGGVVDWTYTGLADYWGNWFYVKDGLLDWSYTGFADYYGTEFYVVNGYVDWSFNGTVGGKEVAGGVVVG